MTRRCLLALPFALVVRAKAAREPLEFRHIQVSVQKEGKTKMRDGRIFVENGLVRIVPKEGEAKTFPSVQIKALTYSYSKHPRWKAGAIAAVPLFVFAIPIFFMKSKKHWLTIQGERDYAVLRLHKGNHKQVTAALQSHTGIEVYHEKGGD